MKVNNIVMAMFLLCILCSGCEEKIGMTTVEYCKYIQEHKAEFIKEKIYENLKFKISVQPASYYVIRNNGVSLSKGTYDSLYKESKGTLYAEMVISSKDGDMNPVEVGITDMARKRERIYYLSYDVVNDFRMCCAGSCSKPVLFHYEQSYNLKKDMTFVMAFKYDSLCKGDEVTIELDDKVFGNGKMKFSFDKKYVGQNIDLKFVS